MAQRGSYAKGVAKREEILKQALEVIARQGYRHASVKEIADAVGLSQAGLLHYFDSKEELFTEVLRKRDEVDAAAFAQASEQADLRTMTFDLADLRQSYVGVIRHNSDVPGLVQLFSRMSVDAADADHPAHRYFIERGSGFRAAFAHMLRARQDAGEMTDRVDAEVLARIFQAVADGLQVQWMLDPSVDMAATVDALFDALAPVPVPVPVPIVPRPTGSAPTGSAPTASTPAARNDAR